MPYDLPPKPEPAMTQEGKLNILIVDDEPLARRRIEALCGRMETVERIDIASGGREALDSIARNRPDIVLLDIDMPDMSGMAVARESKELHQAPDIIFTTAYSQYAVEAFRINAENYLLKPVKEDLLREALDRVLHKKQRDAGRDGRLEERPDTHSNRHSNGYGDRGAGQNADDHWLWAQDGHGSVQVRSSEIGWIIAEGDYMRLCLGDRSYLVHDAMQSLLERLPAGMFIRIHRSAAVRHDLLRDIRRKGRRNYVVMEDGSQLAIGPSYLDAVLRSSR